MSRLNKYRCVQNDIKNIFASAIITVPENNSINIKNNSPVHNISRENENLLETDELISEEFNSENETDCSDNISSASESNEIDIYSNNIQNDLREWSVTQNVSRVCLNALLNVLRKYHPNLPKDGRALKKTPRKNDNIIEMGSGTYNHIG